ncbi:ABC transporter permease [soil metagenome]
MNYKFLISRRFLFSRGSSKFISFITYISILGVTLGVAALIITFSVLNGFEKEIKSKIAGLVSHIQVTSFDPVGIEDSKDALAKIKKDLPDITQISPYVQREGLIKFKDNIEGVILKGIDPVTDLSTARNKIVSGEFNVSPVDSNISRILIGNKLAGSLGIVVGSKVFIFGLKGIPSPVNQPKIKQFIVSGVYETGLKDYDDVILYTDIPSTQKVFDLGKYISGIELNIKDVNKINSAASKLREDLGYPYNARSMFQIFRGLFNWVELQKAPSPVILSLIILVATFNIVGTLLMLVLEKTHSIGILKSLGADKGSIMKIFIYDGILIGILGVIFGNILGLGICFLELKYKFFSLPEFYYMKNVPILIQPELVILVSIVSFILCFFATLIPSYIASKLEPVRSLNFM